MRQIAEPDHAVVQTPVTQEAALAEDEVHGIVALVAQSATRESAKVQEANILRARVFRIDQSADGRMNAIGANQHTACRTAAVGEPSDYFRGLVHEAHQALSVMSRNALNGQLPL
jgi:hypothetical protein